MATPLSWVPRVRPSLLAEVQRHGKFDSSCLNCGGCSVVCDVAYGDVTFPRRSIHQVVLGLKDAVLESFEPWLCHDCGDCSITCPRQADPAASMRTLRRYLTGQYDGTGLGSRILRSRAWHLGSLAAVGALVLALLVFYHLSWAKLPLGIFATPLGVEHMFPKIAYFTWIVYALPALFMLAHVYRMQRLSMASSRVPMRHYLAEAWTILVEVVTQRQMRKCTAEARKARAYQEWLHGGETPGEEFVPRRWLKHWLMVLGTVTMVVLTAFFLRWFQTDAINPVYHPQRWLGYLATACILWATTDILLRRLRRPKESVVRKRGVLTLPLLLWLTAVSGIVLHVFRILGFALAAHYTYAVHLVICVPMIVVEVPFGEWAHMIDRPLALYFQAVRERSREALPTKAGLEPASA